MEIADISQQHYSFGSSNYATVDLLALEIITDDNAKRYDLLLLFLVFGNNISF